ncbi:MAG TPA: hypothetical protein VES36_00225 [Candidatus Limnocylindrales bacterium]|nr:hypothetical protein [Candidatus Limnocylindrales bacterium]
MNQSRAPRYRICVYELRDGTSTQVIDNYGSGFITAVATINDDIMEVHFSEGGPQQLQQHIAEAIAHEYPARRKR